MQKYNLLDLNKSDQWNAYINLIQKNFKNVYFSPQYYEIYQKNGDGIAQCFVFEIDGQIAIYPFLLNSINALGFNLEFECFDIQGVYGFNGILTNSTSQIFFNEFFNCFDEYCLEKNIVAEFLRINPLINNPLIYRQDFTLINDRENICVNLLIDNIPESEYEYSTKKNIRKATKSGLEFKTVYGSSISNEELEYFCGIYFHTMRRNNVSSYYFFNNIFFKNIATKLLDKVLFVFVLFEGKYISCEIVLLEEYIGYSFLGGTLEDYYQYRPNDFLKHHTINFLKDNGYHKYLLGGGPDGVLRYKKSFSKNGVIPFYIGKKIHNKTIYDKIITQWITNNPSKNEIYDKYLLKYRY